MGRVKVTKKKIRRKKNGKSKGTITTSRSTAVKNGKVTITRKKVKRKPY